MSEINNISQGTFPSSSMNSMFVDSFGSIPEVSYNDSGVPVVFEKNCGTWEGNAMRIDTEGKLIDTDLVRVKIVINGTNYVQTNTVRIETPQEISANYYGNFIENKLVFPLTDEVYTLAGESATAFSGIAWAVNNYIILYCGTRTLKGVKTHYNEIITIVNDNHRVRTTQLYEEGVYKHVTAINETRIVN